MSSSPQIHATGPSAGYTCLCVGPGALVALLLVFFVSTAYGQADTTRSAPPADQGAGGSVQFEASDSLIITFDDEEGDTGTLYGNASASYENATLEAHSVIMLFEREELQARGLPSDTGMVGRPRFDQGGEAFSGDELAYNMRTNRGRVVGATTSIQDGFVRGSVVKMVEDSTLYIGSGVYTTCDCVEDPSYSLRADRMKLQDEWLYTGSIRLYIFNIPTPFWLPFGFLPAIEGRRSGPVAPDYGENRELGFYLKNWGWYWAVNDYVDFQLLFDLWTRGSWGVNPRFRYDKRYYYNGQLSLDYVRLRRGRTEDPGFQLENTGRLNWNHSQTIDPSTRLSANVNLTSRDYLRAVSEDYNDRVSQTVQSSINFNKRWNGVGRSLRLDLSQRQVLSTGETSLRLPRLSFSQSRRTPFKRDQRPAGSEEQWYEKITYQYSGSLNNEYDYPSRQERLQAGADTTALDIPWYEALISPRKHRRATGQTLPFDFRASHSIPVNASFSINRLPLVNQPFFLTLTPYLNYEEDWFLFTRRIELASDSTRETQRDPGFFALRQFSSGLSANTTFYGMFPFRVGPFDGFRHTVRPNLSFTYRPDFYDPFWGYTRPNPDGPGRYAKVRGVQQQLQQSLSLSVGNVFETKRVSVVDSTGEEQRRSVKLLDLSLRTSYNAAADSFKLGDIALRARPHVSDRVTMSMDARFSPYRWSTDAGREIDRYTWEDFGVPRLQRFNLSLRTSFQSGQSGPQASDRPSYGPSGPPPSSPSMSGRNDPYGRWQDVDYVDFSIPWSLDFSVNYNTTRNGRTNELRHSATLNSRFDFNLTPSWKISGRTGYDFERWELATTQVSIFRDLDCWEMSFNWIPFGNYESYSFTLQVKSGKLRDLLRLNHPSSDVEGRFQGLLN